MPSVDFVVETDISTSARARQLCSMFDVPPAEKCTKHYKLDVPIESQDWNVGLIVGPSGCGKTTLAKQLFGAESLFVSHDWKSKSVIDDFSKKASVEAISQVCQAVGFNTIPAWLRPFHVLSNGEQFRVTLARLLLEAEEKSTIVFDEFTSVVDRQVAQIASHAVQKYVRKYQSKFVAVSCHSDIIDWLQPDWILNPATGEFTWRSLRRRPEIMVAISPVDYETWKLFAPYHYLTADLNKAARCWALFVDEQPAAFAGMLYRPTNKTVKKPIMGCSRLVTLPDFQGLGLAFVLIEYVAAVYGSIGFDVHTYPAHPALVRGFDKSAKWQMIKKPGTYSPRAGDTSTVGGFGGRPCAVFKYRGETEEPSRSRQLLQFWK